MTQSVQLEPLHLIGSGLSRRFVRNSSLAVGLVYPLWHLLTPDGTNDPWIVWWAVGACFVATGLASAVPRIGDRPLRGMFYVCSWLATAQLMVLAHANAMHPFYAVGSTMAMISTAIGFRSLTSLSAYTAFVAALGAGLYVLAPNPLKLAYWIGLVPVLVAVSYRLRVHLGAAQTVESQQEALERRVEARTAELTRANEQLRREMEERALLEEQLRLSQKMQAVGRLAGGIAHDFNNVLTVIASYGQMLFEGAPNEATRRDIREIIKAGERAKRLTARLLSFTRGNVTQPVVLDLNEVIRGFVGMIRSVVGEDVDTHLDLDPELLRVRADRSQLEQAFLNLVLNARDAMPEGGKLTISTRNLSPEEVRARGIGAPGHDFPMVLLTLTDTGEGMDPATQSRAFEPFFTTKGPDHGTGLGLATVYGMVQQAGGDVRLRSGPGAGTSFDVMLPGLQIPAEERKRTPAATVPQAAGQCVLVVEDDPVIRQLARRILRDAGYSVLDAEDGDVALVILEETHLEIELVMTDVVMPRMSGVELAQRIAALRPELPVLFMSGHMNHPSLREWELPADAALLAKPFTPAELLERVAMAIGPELTTRI